MPELSELDNIGQSIWLDFIRRSFLTSGNLKALIDRGVKGVTSNPAIFEKAIAGSTDYDDDIKSLIQKEQTVHAIYESLAFKDIMMAADQLKAVYETTQARDGYVSLEVNPDLAHDTDQTISEAKRLFEALGKPNVMIKVPATPAGIPAITELIGSGVNVNVTLIFGLANYHAVAEAYIAGLERLADQGPSVTGGHSVGQVASVASFFVSRVDSAVDKALEKVGNSELQGKIAVANSKAAYGAFKNIFKGKRWQELSKQSARVQRVLWASTSTKNPQYRDTLYIDELIGPDTVNTVPPETLDAFCDHGQVALTLTKGLAEAQGQLAQLEDLGIDLAAITKKLQDDGVTAFAEPFAALMQSITEKRDRLKAA